ncbi:MAG: agmatine deiminase family protein [Proteobacteria bacterium]|nr:agmatine deiminase family protein [Pseudomonadota bacterium]
MTTSATAVAEWRWPAEWEPHAATWLSWPHNLETWPGCLADAEAAFAAMVRALCPHERVCINVVDAAMEDRVRALLADAGVAPDAPVACFEIPTDDAWVRDHGPIFVVRGEADAREVALLDFRFDAWGGKYPPWDRDDAVPAAVAGALGAARRPVEFVLEAGSIEGNGEGLVLTTESCLLNANRGGRPRAEVEAVLRETLGAREILWLEDGVAGDDTDGHVDDLTRFVAPRTVVTATERDVADPNHAPLEANRRRLRAWRGVGGEALDVVELPMPPPVVHAGERLPASYANFYVANEVVLVPVFDVPSDARALAILRELWPGRDVVGIPARVLVRGLGAVHCLTQQQPAGRLLRES